MVNASLVLERLRLTLIVSSAGRSGRNLREISKGKIAALGGSSIRAIATSSNVSPYDSNALSLILIRTNGLLQ